MPNMLPDILALLCLIGAVGLLIALSVIDLRTFLLPNVLVLPFALLAPVYHYCTGFSYLGPWAIVIGGVIGFGFMFGMRAAANAYYKDDALGLGDVKLMGAGGLWLGGEGTLLAITGGAFAGLIIGLLYAVVMAKKEGKELNLNKMAVPAGPGFAVGIIGVGIWMFHDFRLF